MLFSYRAKQDRRSEASGVIEAVDVGSAVASLRKMGLYPLEVVPSDTAAAAPAVSSERPLGRSPLALWSRTVGQGIASGLTLTQSLRLLSEQEKGRRLGRVARLLEERISSGSSLADAMRLLGGAFPPMSVSLVRAAEAGGALDQVLEAFGSHVEKEEEIIAKVRAALVYPLFVLAVGMGTVMVLEWVVVPRLVVLFQETGQPLPWVTRFLLALGKGIVWLAPAGAAAFFGFFFAMRRRRMDGTLLETVTALARRAPYLGRLVDKSEMARLSGSLGLLIRQGLPLPHAMGLAAGAVADPRLKERLERAQRQVVEGTALSEAFRRTGVRDPYLLTMIAFGEAQGDLARAFSEVAQRRQEEVDRIVKNLSALIEPALILAVGLVVGGIVFSMLLPIFQLNFTPG